MLNPFKEVNWNPDREEKRKFALSLMIGFPCLAVIWLLIGRVVGEGWHWSAAGWIAGAGFAAGLILWLVPAIAKPFYVVWYGLACCLGLVIGNLLLTVFYLTFVTGIGLALRAFRGGTLRKGFDKRAMTYWKDVTPVTDPRRYYQQF